MNTRTCSICEMGQLILDTEKITVEHLGQQGQIESQYSMCDYCNSEQVVGNGHLQTDLDGKNKKALYLQANNRAFKTFLDG